MDMLYDIAAAIPRVLKVMLTCFLSNQTAIAFYHKQGYLKDPFSPMPKMLRHGAKVEADYVILSKDVPRQTHLEAST